MSRRFLSHSSCKNFSLCNRTVGTFPRPFYKASHPSSTFYECQTPKTHGRANFFFLENLPQLTRDALPVDVWKVAESFPKNSQASMSGWIKTMKTPFLCLKTGWSHGILWLLDLHLWTGIDWILARLLSRLNSLPAIHHSLNSAWVSLRTLA